MDRSNLLDQSFDDGWLYEELCRFGRQLASCICVSAADARSAKELREGKAGDQRAAANAGYEEDQFFCNYLHSNSCDGG